MWVALILLAGSLFGQADAVADHAAAAAAATSRGDFGSAEAHNRAIVKLDPRLAEAHINLGLSLFSQRKYIDAVTAFHAGLERKPELWNGWLFLGIAELNRNRLEQAVPPLEKYTAARGSDHQGHYYLGLALLGLERFREAEAALGRARELDRNNVDVLYHLAQSYLGQARAGRDRDRLQQAYEDSLRRIAAVDPSSIRLAQLRAGYHQALGETAKARAELETIVARGARVRGLRYTLGCLYIESRDYEKAVAELEAELRLDAPWPRTHLQLGHAYVELGKVEKALPALEAAREAEPANGTVWFELGRAHSAAHAGGPAIEAFRKAIALGDRRSNVYYRLAIALRQTGQGAEAQQAMAESERLRKSEDGGAAPPNPDASIETGVRALNEGRYQEAAQLFEQLWGVSPLCQVPFYLGLARQRLNDGNGAIVAFRGATECAPGLTQAHLALAGEYAAKGDENRALGEYEQVLGRTPENAAAMRAAAALYLRHELNEKAVAVLERLTEAEPGDVRAKADLGAAYAATSAPAKAEHQFRAALRLNPLFPSALVGLGNLILKSGNASAALEPLERAVKLAPVSFEARYVLAAAYEQLGRKADALAQLEAVEVKDPDGYYRLARLYGETGRTADRQLALARFSEKKAELSRRQEAEREITRLVSQAGTLVQRNELGDAAKLLEKAVQLQPLHDGNLFRLAGLYYDLKEFQRAQPLIDQAIQLAPAEWSYHLLAGLNQKASGNEAASRQSFETARRLNHEAPVPDARH